MLSYKALYNQQSNKQPMKLFIPEEINKEAIPQMEFPSSEVLSSEFEKEMRNENLFKAMIMGNTYKKKVKIIFDTIDGTKVVKTTIWASTENDILLKNGINIPINSIREIEIAA